MSELDGREPPRVKGFTLYMVLTVSIVCTQTLCVRQELTVTTSTSTELSPLVFENAEKSCVPWTMPFKHAQGATHKSENLEHGCDLPQQIKVYTSVLVMSTMPCDRVLYFPDEDPV